MATKGEGCEQMEVKEKWKQWPKMEKRKLMQRVAEGKREIAERKKERESFERLANRLVPVTAASSHGRLTASRAAAVVVQWAARRGARRRPIRRGRSWPHNHSCHGRQIEAAERESQVTSRDGAGQLEMAGGEQPRQWARVWLLVCKAHEWVASVGSQRRRKSRG